ncbi:unnamed protein product [Cylindrotheca closterium]|uniref:Uncharacterized protein n=1 Tax=Cylindrotheca closterium TaxID=2856 RepID=A0AAD2FYH4_9STRA|nr:unnamed protein product [Cylindrotheca closterium]
MRIKDTVNVVCSIRKLAYCTRSSPVSGALFTKWDDDVNNADKWNGSCTGYAESYSDYPDAKSWEEKGIATFKMCNNQYDALEVWMENLLDPRLLADKGTPQFDNDWESRAFLFGLVTQCPLMIFGYNDPVDNKFNSQSYWNKEDPYNPHLRFLENPLPLIWLIAAPWADSSRDPVSKEASEEMRLIQRHNEFKKVEGCRRQQVQESL